MQHTRILVDQIQINPSGLKEYNIWLQPGAVATFNTHKVRCQDVDYDRVWELYNEKYDAVDFTKKSIERAVQLGRNVAAAMNMPIEQVKYLGEEHSVSCPVCHCNVVVIPEDLPYIACPVCWVRGEVKNEKGKMSVAWNMNDVKNPRYSASGQEHHWYWLTSHAAKRVQFKQEIENITNSFKSYGKVIKPERLTK